MIPPTTPNIKSPPATGNDPSLAAPNADRKAISRCRSRMRASSRLAILPQAISNTRIPNQAQPKCRSRIAEQCVYLRGHLRRVCLVLVFGCCFAG